MSSYCKGVVLLSDNEKLKLLEYKSMNIFKTIDIKTINPENLSLISMINTTDNSLLAYLKVNLPPSKTNKTKNIVKYHL